MKRTPGAARLAHGGFSLSEESYQSSGQWQSTPSISRSTVTCILPSARVFSEITLSDFSKASSHRDVRRLACAWQFSLMSRRDSILASSILDLLSLSSRRNCNARRATPPNINRAGTCRDNSTMISSIAAPMLPVRLRRVSQQPPHPAEHHSAGQGSRGSYYLRHWSEESR